jgi:hypothetical protein
MNVRPFHLPLYLAFVVVLSADAAEITAPEFEALDYGRDISSRSSMLKYVAYADPQEIKSRMSHLLQTGGILALRDYLVFLGNTNPEKKDQVHKLPMSLGLQGRWNLTKNGAVVATHEKPALLLSDLAVGRPLDDRIETEKQYSYYDLVRIFEAILPLGHLRPAMDVHQDAPIVFQNIAPLPTVAPDAPRTSP